MFFVLLLVCIAVYVIVVRAYYWGSRKGPPSNKKR